jgi:hypothetical protein
MELNEVSQLLEEINCKLPSSLLRKNNLDPSGLQLMFWKNVASNITPLLDENKVEYVLVKAFDVSQAHMVDVDLFVENEIDMVKTIRILKNENYDVRQLQYFYPFKTTAYKPGQRILVDLYHKPKWYDFTYAPPGFVSSSRIRGTIHGIEAFIPPPEINVYIVATHGYSHGRFTLEEILHIITVILKEKPKLLTLMPLIRRFRTWHALYCYVWLANEIIKQRFGNDNAEINKFLKELRRYSLTRYFSDWLEGYSTIEYLNFPIVIPPKMLAFAGLTKLLIGTNLDPSVRRYDEMLIAARKFFFSGFLYGQFGQILQKSL